MKTLISTAAMVLMFGGVAFAQDDALTTQALDPNEPDQHELWDNPLVMQPFFTDDTMTTLRSEEEVRAAFMAMPEEDRVTMTGDCQNVDTIQSESIKLEEFCGMIGNM